MPFRLYLMGFMGSGKSFVGKQIASKTNFSFHDLDDLIIEKAGMSISEIFTLYGEDYFRKLERECLFETEKFKNVIIATGGGTPCFFNNIEWINQHGLSIFLDANIPVLIKRLQGEIEKRPLLKGKNEIELQAFIQNKLTQRRNFYELAHIIYHLTSGNEPIIEDLLKFTKGMRQ